MVRKANSFAGGFKSAPVLISILIGFGISWILFSMLRSLETSSIGQEFAEETRQCTAFLESILREKLSLVESTARTTALSFPQDQAAQLDAIRYLASQSGDPLLGMAVATSTVRATESRDAETSPLETPSNVEISLHEVSLKHSIAGQWIFRTDIAESPVFHKLLQRAEGEGQAVAGILWKDTKSGQEVPTWIAACSIGRSRIEAKPDETQKASQQRFLVGYAILRDVFREAFAQRVPSDIDLAVVEETKRANSELLYFRTVLKDDPTSPLHRPIKERWGSLQQARKADLQGLDWKVILWAPREYVDQRRTSTPWYVLYSGVAVTSVLVIYLVSSFQRRSAIERLVAQRTSSLKETTRKLEEEIERRKAAEANLVESRNKVQRLSGHLQASREEERLSVARAIHDQLGQVLTGLKMDSAWLLKRIPDEHRELVDRALSIEQGLDNTVSTVKGLLTELRPALLEDLGLQAAIEWQIEEYQKRTGIRCKLDMSFDEAGLDQRLSMALFRIVQEGLTNIARHAHASEAKVQLERSNCHLVLEIADNGKGIEPHERNRPDSFGLLGIQERVRCWGGEIEIVGKSKRGTVLKIRIPLTNGE